MPQAAELYHHAAAAAAGGDLGATLAARASLDGVDAGDHPPITPVKLATPRQCEGEAGWPLYQYICRHFVASLSADCTFETASFQHQLRTPAPNTSSQHQLPTPAPNTSFLFQHLPLTP